MSAAIAPLARHGGVRQPGQGSAATLRLGRGRDYLLARLARDCPNLLARVTAGELSVHSAAVEAGIVRPRRKRPHLARINGVVEWFTPPDIIEAARAVLGTIDLDPASCEQAQQTVRAATFHTFDQDGLQQPWRGRVWLNPPYAQPAIEHFVRKLVSAVQAGDVTAALLLTNASTDTACFHRAAAAASAICLIRGRVKFISPSGPQAAPLQGQAIFYFGADVEAFAHVFSERGFIVRNARATL